MDQTRLGAILLESRIIREEDLERCLEIQALTSADRPLGQILVEQGVISAEALECLLQLQATRRGRSRPEDEPLHAAETDRLLATAIERGATELHLSEGRCPMIRIGCTLQVIDDEPVIGPEVWGFIQHFMGPDVLEQLADKRSVTRRFVRPDQARGRITAVRHFDGIHVAASLQPWDVRPLHDLVPDARVGQILASERGLLIVSGENASGLAETLASVLLEVARTQSDRFVLVLDDDQGEFPDLAVERRRHRHDPARRRAHQELPLGLAKRDASEP